MIRLPKFTSRQVLIVVHDLVMTAAAILAAFYIRFEDVGLAERQDTLIAVVPAFMLYAGVIYYAFHLYQGKWRFASLPDLFNILRAVTVLAVSLLVLDYLLVAPNMLGTFFFGKITIVLYWFLQMFFLGGPRIAYRAFRYQRTQLERTRHGKHRPLLNTQDQEGKLRELMTHRAPLYESIACIVVDTDGRQVRTVADEILQKLDARGAV